MATKIYKHPKIKSRVTIKSKSGSIVTLNLIDEPKEYKGGTNRYGYQTRIVDIRNITQIK